MGVGGFFETALQTGLRIWSVIPGIGPVVGRAAESLGLSPGPVSETASGRPGSATSDRSMIGGLVILAVIAGGLYLIVRR